MSGHSKWHNIAAKKGKADAARGKVFTKLGRELLIAVKQGGPDPAGNSKLKDVIAKCKAANMPNDTINNAIKKASGSTDSANYEEITYEGYGVSGVAVIVIEKESTTMSEDDLMLLAIDAGAEDFEAQDECYEITTAPENFSAVREELEKNNLEFVEAEVRMVPNTYVKLSEKDAERMENFLEKLDDLDDVSDVYHNWDEE